MDDQPFALHITWTCYGTWLPGDPRGHVSNIILPKRGFVPKANQPGTACDPGDARTEAHAHNLQKHPTVYLNPSEALCVAEALMKAAQTRGWRILRAAVMANHIHVVLMDCPNDGPAVRRILKGNTQAVLSDLVSASRRWWTAGGSDRYKNDWPAIEEAVHYVAAQEGILAGIDDMRVFSVASSDSESAPKNERRGLPQPSGGEARAESME